LSTPQQHSSDVLLARLEAERAIEQLLHRSGRMRQLGSEGGVPMLDWVEAVPRLLDDPAGLEGVEREARALLQRGVRHLIWSGMGGSVLTVQLLRALGFCEGAITIHPLDSTDPAAPNGLVRRLADEKGVTSRLTSPTATDEAERASLLASLFTDVVMVAVAMGKTSEEPISHLKWFLALLREGSLDPTDHAHVMAIPDSFLEKYAFKHGLPLVPLQLDGGYGTPGRMSAPGTRIFLLPAALELATHGGEAGALRALLRRAWVAHDLDGAMTRPRDHPFVRLAIRLAAAAHGGACGVCLATPPELDALRWWAEQLFEESLGKGGKGVVVFADQPVPVPNAEQSHALPLIHVRVLTAPPVAADDVPDSFTIVQPLLAAEQREERLAGVASLCLGLQLAAALYGYLCDIPFAGQPAVEAYKRRARELRAQDDPLRTAMNATDALSSGGVTLLPSSTAPALGAHATPARLVAAALHPRPAYLDLTLNGEIAPEHAAALDEHLRALGNGILGIPVKLRRAPASYHSTEQSEMDGPAGLVSLRALALHSAPSLLGSYDAAFLRAQALGTWQAMNEQGRTCFLLIVDGPADGLAPTVCRLLAAVAEALAAPSPDG
jgi:hypothetical protein